MSDHMINDSIFLQRPSHNIKGGYTGLDVDNQSSFAYGAGASGYQEPQIYDYLS